MELYSISKGAHQHIFNFTLEDQDLEEVESSGYLSPKRFKPGSFHDEKGLNKTIE
jgi:hypothetical protein